MKYIFLLNCSVYSDIRYYLVQAACDRNENFNSLNCVDQLIFLMSEPKLQSILANTLFNMYRRRKSFL